jgi:single-strand DNA-binding protein
MAGLNKVMVIGNLGRDPEVRYSQSGMAICNLSVAVTERVKDGDSWKDATEWFRVVCFGKTAESAAQHLAKGRQVFAEGRLKSSRYTDKDGVEKTSVEVLCSSLTFLGGAGGGRDTPDNAMPPGPRAKVQPAPSARPTRAVVDPQIADDQLPF